MRYYHCAFNAFIADFQIVLSSEHQTRSKLYFGNTTHIFMYDGVVSLVKEGTVGLWTVQEDLLYYTLKFMTLPAGFDVKQESLVNLSIPVVQIGSVKGSLPQDLKLVDARKKGIVSPC